MSKAKNGLSRQRKGELCVLKTDPETGALTVIAGRPSRLSSVLRKAPGGRIISGQPEPSHSPLWPL